MLMQVYNNYCSLFLKELGVNSFWQGIMMALDNVFALFMLPFFGNLSDKTKSKLGKRSIFIVIGVTLASLFTPLIIIAYLKKSIPLLVAAMGLVLVSVNFYRSPAVALMPDVTPKPLRSKANAIINLVGYAGGIVVTVLFMLTADSSKTIWIPFIIIPLLGIIVLIAFLLKVRENKILEEVKEEMEEGERQAEIVEQLTEDKPLGKHNKFNLIILLISVALWKFGFNAIESFGTSFASDLTPDKVGWWGTVSTLMIIVSIIAFIPAGKVTEKLGRKRTVLLGNALMILGLIFATFLTIIYNENMNTMLFILPIIPLGIGWAWINVNSYTMVVELSTKQNVGKYTGWYYMFSNVAEILTPILFGLVANFTGYLTLFMYSLVIINIAAIIFMTFKSKDELEESK
ncbi:MAG: MFS transporter [Clostridia bacterium]|nr:MFS transporter [Clostridia bacterium]